VIEDMAAISNFETTSRDPATEATQRQVNRSATMTTGKIFTKWDQTHSELWSHQPIRLEHEMHKSTAFSIDDLAKLDRVLSARTLQPGADRARGSSRVWREGDIGNLSGREVIEAISRGGLWLNMRDVGMVDSRYRKLVDQMFEEICAEVPGFEVRNPTRRAS